MTTSDLPRLSWAWSVGDESDQGFDAEFIASTDDDKTCITPRRCDDMKVVYSSL